MYILVSQLVQNRPTTTLERKLPLTTINAVALSSLRDDWLALNTRSNEEGDPVISCVFKTEFIAHLQQQTNGGVSVLVGQNIEYAKKKDKKALIKFTKDESVQRNDVYKSHEVRVSSGAPPTSVSNPPARRKPGVVRPVTQGKLLKSGGPGGPGKPAARKPAPAPKPKPVARTLPTGNVAATPPAPPMFAKTNGSAVPAAPIAPKAPSAPVAKKAPTAVARAPPPPPGRPAAPPPVSFTVHNGVDVFETDFDSFRHPQRLSGKFYTTSSQRKPVRLP